MYIHYFYKYTKRLHADIKYESYLQQVAVQEKMIYIILFNRSEKRTFNYNLIDKKVYYNISKKTKYYRFSNKKFIYYNGNFDYLIYIFLI